MTLRAPPASAIRSGANVALQRQNAQMEDRYGGYGPENGVPMFTTMDPANATVISAFEPYGMYLARLKGPVCDVTPKRIWVPGDAGALGTGVEFEVAIYEIIRRPDLGGWECAKVPGSSASGISYGAAFPPHFVDIPRCAALYRGKRYGLAFLSSNAAPRWLGVTLSNQYAVGSGYVGLQAGSNRILPDNVVAKTTSTTVPLLGVCPYEDLRPGNVGGQSSVDIY